MLIMRNTLIIMDQKISRPVTYIGLINRFWRLDETYQFSASETRVYFYLLKVANTLGWPASFEHSDARAAAACGVSLPVFKVARKALTEAGLIQYIAGGAGHAKKTAYHFTGCEDCTEDPRINCRVTCHRPVEEPVKKEIETSPVTTDLGERKQLPNSAPYININTRQDKRSDQIRKEEGATKSFDLHLNPEIMPIPNDGVPRNTDGLIRNLRQLQASDKEIQSLLQLSDFGKIGHPVWSLIFEAKNSNGAIKQPVRFIFSRLLPAKKIESVIS